MLYKLFRDIGNYKGWSVPNTDEAITDVNTLFDCIQLLLAVVIYCSWLFLIVFMHFVRDYGKSGFKVEMYSIYCSMKEVFSFFYILSHWVCFGIMTCLLIIDYEIDGKILPEYIDDDNNELYNAPYRSKITLYTKLNVWFYTSFAIYFLVGVYNTLLAVELFCDRGRVPDGNPVFARPDYIGQNLGWR